MMRKFYRLMSVACICLLALMAGMFAGCSSSQGSSDEAAQKTPDVAEGEAPTQEVMVEVQTVIPVENMQVEAVMTEFMNAYFAGDEDAIRQYLAESFGQDVEVYSDPEHGQEVQINTIRGLNYDLSGNIGEECDMAAEFTVPGEDSFTYLTVGFVREESGWKVSFYGLEK